MPYATDHWEWKYGEGWRAEEVEIAHATALLQLAAARAALKETR